MQKVTLTTEIVEDRDEVLLTMLLEGEPLGHIFMNGADTETVAHQLGAERAKLQDRVSTELDPGSRLTLKVDPIWRTMPHENGVVLAIRHPGFGWLSFLIPEESMQPLAERLLKPNT